MPTYRYRPQILKQLETFGVFPRPHTDPVIVRDFLKFLYTMEIRTMRVEQRARERDDGGESRPGYVNRVLELRERYPILSIPVEWWVERDE